MTAPLKVLFLTYSGEDGASARYRVYQFLPHLQRAGIHAEVHPFYEDRHYRLIMEGGSAVKQLAMMPFAYLRRLRDVLHAKSFDVVFFHREAVPIGPVWLERLARRRGARTIFDLDDATYMNNPHAASWLRRRLRNPRRVDRAMAAVDCVCAANEHIAEYARKLNGHVEMIPGAEEMARYEVEPARPRPDRFVVGWTGSHSTEPYLNLMKKDLSLLATRIPNLTVMVIGGGSFSCPGVDVVHVPWTLQDEIGLVKGFDVGVMPLPNDEWSKGKCGGKARIYMAAGIPAVASAIGYNRELIEHGRTGMLVEPGAPWVEPILTLHRDKLLRLRMGRAAQAHVTHHLSVEALAPRMVRMIRDVAAGR
jgi:glycosyltransferase involved in cell wall biosynthesis